MSAARARSSLGRDTLWALIALGALLAVPYLTSSRIALDFCLRLAAYGLLATSLHILVGYGGLV